MILWDEHLRHIWTSLNWRLYTNKIAVRCSFIKPESKLKLQEWFEWLVYPIIVVLARGMFILSHPTVYFFLLKILRQCKCLVLNSYVNFYLIIYDKKNVLQLV